MIDYNAINFFGFYYFTVADKAPGVGCMVR